MFESSGHNSIFFFTICQNYYELPKRTRRANGNIYHIIKLNKSRDIRSQDKGKMDMTLNEIKYLISTCWDKKTPPSHY